MTGSRFANEVVVATGGTHGIGLAIAPAFAAQAAALFVTGHRQDARDAAVEAVGSRVTGVRGRRVKGLPFTVQKALPLSERRRRPGPHRLHHERVRHAGISASGVVNGVELFVGGEHAPI